MVEDSIMQKFNGGDVAVAGIDIWNSSDAEIDSFITATGATFPIAKNGASTGNAYGVIANSMVVIDQNGVVRFVQQLGTSTVTFSQMRQTVGGAAATMRGLLSSGAVDRRISAHPALLDPSSTVTCQDLTILSRFGHFFDWKVKM